MVVHRIITDCDSSSETFILERRRCLHHAEEVLALDAAALPVVRDQRELVFRGILVVREAVGVVTYLRLYVVEVTERMELRLCDRGGAFFARHLDKVDVVVVAVDWPVDHDFAAREQAVGHHLAGRPYRLAGCVGNVVLALAAVVEEALVVALRSGDGDVVAVVFEGHDHGQVLHHVVRANGHGLTGV